MSGCPNPRASRTKRSHVSGATSNATATLPPRPERPALSGGCSRLNSMAGARRSLTRGLRGARQGKSRPARPLFRLYEPQEAGAGHVAYKPHRREASPGGFHAGCSSERRRVVQQLLHEKSHKFCGADYFCSLKFSKGKSFLLPVTTWRRACRAPTQAADLGALRGELRRHGPAFCGRGQLGRRRRDRDPASVIQRFSRFPAGCRAMPARVVL